MSTPLASLKNGRVLSPRCASRELKQQQAELLDPWLAAVRCCRIAELVRFGRGIEQDKAAVSAVLSLPYSNGVVEGHDVGPMLLFL